LNRSDLKNINARSHLNLGSSFVNAVYTSNGKNFTATSIVKYGGFGDCAEGFEQYFTEPDLSIPEFPPLPLAEPSWITRAASTPGVLNQFGILYPGVYKFDITFRDVQTMNQAATMCLEMCQTQNQIVPNSCQYGTYGYEEGHWICNLWKRETCNNIDLVWAPAEGMVPVNSSSEVPPTFS
jgi:hypothetical protein